MPWGNAEEFNIVSVCSRGEKEDLLVHSHDPQERQQCFYNSHIYVKALRGPRAKQHYIRSTTIIYIFFMVQ